MTENVTRISPSEITAVRLTCPSCGLTTEAKVNSLKKLFCDGQCPHCKHEATDGEDAKSFSELRNALKKIAKLEDDFSIQFVLENSTKEIS